MKSISSRQNPAVRLFREAAGEPDRRGAQLLLDGAHLVRDAHTAGLSFEIAAVAASRMADPSEERSLAETLQRDGVQVVVASDPVFASMSPVRTPSGIVAIARRTATRASAICARANAFILVIVDVQDPGNLGSLLRVAEAGGVTGALVCSSGGTAAANPFSWKALRGSMGSALRLPIDASLEASEALDAITAAGGRTIAAVPRDGRDPDGVTWTGRVGLVLGGEGHGVPSELVDRCDQHTTIPMAEGVESLNVAASGAILIYAARRQRT